MLQVSLFVFTLLFQANDPLDLAEAAKQEGLYWKAEGFYLTLSPEPNQITRIGEGLSEIALRSDSPSQKQEFYRSYLAKSKSWRGVALLVLSSLSARESQWQDFENYSELLLQEYRPQGPVIDRLLYYLARYTTVDPSQLNLFPAQTNWFQACRDLPPDQVFPGPDRLPMSFSTTALAFLNDQAGPETLRPPKEPTTRDQYLNQLIHVKRALNEDDMVNASKGLNQLASTAQEFDPGYLKIAHYRLLKSFFQKREKEESAAVTQRNLDLITAWSVFPYLLIPDALKAQPKAEENEESIAATAPAAADVVEQPVVEKSVPETPVSETSVPTVETDTKEVAEETFTSLDRKLIGGQRSLELQIRRLEATTTFQKIYKNYLLGVHYLNLGRWADAKDRLVLTERLVVDFPFPNLETKVLLALGLYHQLTGNAAKANWYRISAMQVWDVPENTAILVHDEETPQPSPYRVLLDASLQQVNEDNAFKQLLYYSELEQFNRLRRRAYTRNALTVNPILGNQIKQIGNQLHRLVRSLSQNTQHQSTPRRYNDTLEIWNQLWQQTLPFYRSQAVPSLADIQEELGGKDRLLSFVEGNRFLGVLVITKTQAFALGLGSIGNYNSLDGQQQFEFLTGRLGSIWNNDGMLLIKLSKSLKGYGFDQILKSEMKQPEKLQLIFSLKSFTQKAQPDSCRNIALITSQDSETSVPIDTADWGNHDAYQLENLTPQQWHSILETHDHLVYSGPLALNEKGLALSQSQSQLLLHEIVHINPDLCSLTLMSKAFDSWDLVLDELELINPQSAPRLTLTRKDTLGTNFDFETKTKGISIP